MLNRVPLRKIHDLSLKTIDGQDLGSCNFQDSLDVNNNFVEIWIVLFKLLEGLSLIYFEYLLLNSNPSPLIFLSLLLKVRHNHVSK